MLAVWFLVSGCGSTGPLSDFPYDAGAADAVRANETSAPDAMHADATDSGTRDAVDVAIPVSCASLSLRPGDLIQGSGPAVYYVDGYLRRHVFVNETTYFTRYPDFSGICIRPDAFIASVRIAGNVTIRPGTWLIKITTNPKVYAITRSGVLHWIEGEDIALALYGPQWNRRVRDVPDGFFINYSVGRSISTAIHPDGALIRSVGSTQIYVMENGRRRRFLSDAVFRANRFRTEFVIDTTIVYPDGQDVTGTEPLLRDPF